MMSDETELVELAEAVERIEEEIAVHDACYHPGRIGHGFVQVRVADLKAVVAGVGRRNKRTNSPRSSIG